MILWIDDEFDLLTNYGDKLSKAFGLEIVYAQDISTALTILDGRKASILILDINIERGALDQKFAHLDDFFESDADNAGFGFLSILAKENIIKPEFCNSMKSLIVCSNYSNRYFERYLSSNRTNVEFFPKISLIDKFAAFEALVESLISKDGAEHFSPLGKPDTISAAEESAIETPLERAFNDTSHELKRNLARCSESVNEAIGRAVLLSRTREIDDFSKVLNQIEIELNSSVDQQDEFIDSLFEQFTDRRAIENLERIHKAHILLKEEIDAFNRARITDIFLIIERVDLYFRGISKVIHEKYVDIWYPCLALFQLMSLREIESRLRRATNVLLEFESPMRSSKDRDKEFFVFDVIKETSADLEDFAKNRSVLIDSKYDKIKNSRLYGDPEGFRRLIENLLENGIKYSHRMQRRKSWVVIRARSLNLKQIVIEFESWGAMIDADEIEAIFESGRRGKKAMGDGSGRGLKIAAEQVQRFGGTISVRSDRNERFVKRQEDDDDEAFINTFTVTLPVQAI